MRSNLLLPILGLAVIAGLAMLISGTAPAGEIPLTVHYKVLAPIGHGNLTIFPVVATTSHDTQEFLTLDEGLRSGDVIVSESGNVAPLVRPRHGYRAPRYNPGDGAEAPGALTVSYSYTQTATGILDIKQIAIGRLVLDNFPHIKSYWQMVTAKMAQISLRFGADDIDGTVIEEKIYHDAGATTPQGMRREELVRLIREAGREPIERDTLYRPVTRTETSVTVAV